MPYQDYTTYTEVDPNNRISVATNVLTITALTGNEDAYVYKDMGVDYFSGDFTHFVDVIYTSITGAHVTAHWTLSNIISDLLVLSNTSSGLSVLRYEASGVAIDYVREVNSGTVYQTSYTDAVSPVNRYYKIVRNESVGTYGTIYLYIYSNSARTTLLATLSIALHTSKKDYRYLYATQTHNNGSLGGFTGRTENLDLNIESVSPKYTQLERGIRGLERGLYGG